MREMKYSGVEWMEDIPASWNMIRFKDKYQSIKEIAGESSSEYERLALTLGGVIKRPKDDSEGLQPKAFDGYQILRENDFVFKMIDLQNVSTSRVGLSPYTGLVSPAYIRFCSKNKNQFNKFVYYYLMSMYYNCVFNSLGGDGVRSALNASDMGMLMIPFPSEHEQMLIVEAIESQTDKVDALIANQEAQIVKLKAYKQSLITEVVTKGLDPNVPMKDSGVKWIGEIPKHWNACKATRFIQNTQNGLTRRDLSESSGHIVLKLKNISADGEIDYSDINRINLTEKEIQTYSLIDGDFLFVRVNGSRALVGKCAIFNSRDSIVAYNDHIIRVRLLPLMNRYYYRYYLLSSCGKTEVELHTVTSAGQFTISGSGLRDVWTVLPPIDEQERIVDYLDAKCSQIDRLIVIKQEKIEKLNQYKKSLIYEYVTGKKEV